MATCRIRFIVFFLLATGWAHAQANRYMVFFKDKNGSPHSISSPETFLSSRAISRRNAGNVAVTADDIPVTPSYVSLVHAVAGVKVFFTSRWLNGVLMEATPAAAAVVQGLGIVSGVELVAPGTQLQGGRRRSKDVSHGTRTVTVVNAPQLQMLGLDAMQGDGYRGEGVWVAVLDSGFPAVNTDPAFQSLRDDGRIVMTKDFVFNSGNVYQYYEHGTNVLSVMTAVKPGIYNGGAPKASYLLFATEDYNTEYRVEEYNWLFAAEAADSAGADIIQSSLGYSLFDDPNMDYKITDLDGKTTVVAKAAVMARDRGVIVVASAGNEGNTGWHYVVSPADADGILAAGAVNESGVKAVFSSVGPTADSRLKPDVAAWGVGTSIVRSDGTVGSLDGTSLAAPLVSSLMAGVRQAYPTLLPKELIAAAKASASQNATPDNNLGYGIPHYRSIKNYLSSTTQTEWVSLYPNPAQRSCFLIFKDLPEGIVELSFYDIMGRQRFTTAGLINWENNPVEFRIDDLAAGMYIMHVNSGGRVANLRFIKL